MYEVFRQPDGTTEKQCVHVWEFDRAAAIGYRVRKLAVMGYYYGFALTWPPNVDVTGKEVEIVFGYERADGQIVTGTPRRAMVPGPRPADVARQPREAAPRATPSPAVRRPLDASPEMRARVRERLRELSGEGSPEAEPRPDGGGTAPYRMDN
jgi:hypothetical protein